ncbi:MAG: hypothetical protein V7637_5552 [Mycobacteriales bacterium]
MFLDYQNVYKGARSCFHKRDDPHVYGQIDPLKLAQLLVDDSPFDRMLQQVRIYRGIPSSSHDPKGYGACSSQCASWAADPRVSVTLRPLSYPATWLDTPMPGERPREKGIDVALAIDYVVMAVRGEYDVGILMSTDTDLKPALEAVATMTATDNVRAEVAAWRGATMGRRLGSVRGRKIWCHWLAEQAYTAIADGTNYS